MEQIDVHDLIGLGNDGVGEPFPHFDPDEFFDRVVEAFQMLDVQGRDHVNAGRQDFLHILVALSVSASRHVGVGQFVDQGHGRPPGQHGVQIHLFDLDAPVFPDDPRQDLQAFAEVWQSRSGRGFRRNPTTTSIPSFFSA